MRHLHHLFRLFHLVHPLRLLLAIYVLLSAAVLAFLLWRSLAARRHRPKIAKADVVYQESFASGASQKNALTQVGGANHCLRLVVTKDILWVTPWFPFSLLAGIYDLEHVVLLRSIVSIDPLPSSKRAGLLLSYADDRGANHSLKLYPKNRDAFLRALSIAPK
jgi:hypothetical protein